MHIKNANQFIPVEEDWADIIGYEGIYRISTHGRVFSVRAKRCMKPQSAGAGYLMVMLSNVTRNQVYIHREVLKAFKVQKRLPECTDVNHKNGNKKDNRIQNLEWVTKSENSLHAYKNGLMDKRGERAGGAKLSEKEALEIFYSKSSSSELAQKYGVQQGTIRHIKNKSIWKCLWEKEVKRAS